MSQTPGSTPTHDPGAVATVRDLVKDERTCMLTTVGPDGSLVSRPMATQEVEFDGDLWFFSEASSPKVAEVQADPRVNVGYAGSSSWVSVSGRAEVVRDPAKNEELWNPFAEAWFAKGPKDPDVVLIRVRGESAEYWDSPGGRVASVIALVKAKVTGDKPDVGDNETVQL
ncbi:pyridoxamine 5'-phosphate oxidase family protein [Pedococcus ginsenosidimutans]